jgi:hypothetical protein
VAAENLDKTRLEQFDALEEKLRKLNLALPANMQNDNNTHSRLLLACEGNPTFKFACQNTTLRLTDLISSLRAAAASEDRTSKIGIEVMLTDRRYHKTYDNCQGHSYRDKPEYKRDRPYDRNRGREVNCNKGNYRRQNNDKCWVCGKETCRSYKHTKEDIEKARERCPLQYRHFLVDDDDIDDYDEYYDEEANLAEDTNATTDKADVFMTIYGPVQGEDLFQSFVNNSTRHALGEEVSSSIELDIKTPLEALSYSNSLEGRYNSRRFEGILIDTGAAAASSAGYH